MIGIMFIFKILERIQIQINILIMTIFEVVEGVNIGYRRNFKPLQTFNKKKNIYEVIYYICFTSSKPIKIYLNFDFFQIFS